MVTKLLYLSACCLAAVRLAHGCPMPCVCQDKYSHQFADCAYKNLAAVPQGLPPNVTTLSLSANKIRALLRGSFAGTVQVTSLWLAHNEIGRLERGCLAPLQQLKNLDLSHNQIVEFPWADLRNLTALQLLKMNNNLMVSVPADAFGSLRDLRSLRINSNKFRTLHRGTFDSLASLSHLQIYSNPFSCGCELEWLRSWILEALISIPERQDIVCWEPQGLEGTPVVELPELHCRAPGVSLSSQPSNPRAEFPDGSSLALHCHASGNPPPEVRWKIRTAGGEMELNEAPAREAGGQDLDPHRKQSGGRYVLLKNGTLVIPRLSKAQEGRYTCLASNPMGSNDSSLNVLVTPSPKHGPGYSKGPVPDGKPDPKMAKNSVLKPEGKERPMVAPTAGGGGGGGVVAVPAGGAASATPAAQNCAQKEGSHYISNHAFNQSSQMKQHTFDFGVIALDVSETDARVQLTPFQKSARNNLQMLYLCMEEGGKEAAVVQWSTIESGVNSYRFQGLTPGSNYTLCLTYTGPDCQVQVVFTTKRKIPSLLIMIVVSCFLLGLATIPLLGATCCHLMYKYRGKTYKLIMKTQVPGELGKNAPSILEASASFPGSDKLYQPSEAGDESVAADSIPCSQSKANQEEFEAGSEYSDRLPLGAEAVNISQEINGNYRRPVR
ncbi:immunoglobulin superfamily containing leucine-rich repeat protein 2 [Carcharodon carcharias]|uniref:immunoglobulin superfamily containing leucine-rich repeat protein 2 n=1 Tax=Carcharodon carcharias TaxID=13397 RepID=UPI001B7E156D|nr:immunoglobulin superfamily containing leucine-rich repeat protein 2 [Carcharodon carcharias]